LLPAGVELLIGGSGFLVPAELETGAGVGNTGFGAGAGASTVLVALADASAGTACTTTVGADAGFEAPATGLLSGGNGERVGAGVPLLRGGSAAGRGAAVA